MTRREVERQTQQADTLRALGFTREEAEALRRISMTLHRWYELECGSDSACLVRGRFDGAEFTYDDNGDTYEEYAGVSGKARYHRVPDRERGAVRRLQAIIDARNARQVRQTACGVCGLDIEGFYPFSEDWRDRGNNAHGSDGHAHTADDDVSLRYYLQTDPRGASLYILRPGDVPQGADADAYYNRGICVY